MQHIQCVKSATTVGRHTWPIILFLLSHSTAYYVERDLLATAKFLVSYTVVGWSWITSAVSNLYNARVDTWSHIDIARIRLSNKLIFVCPMLCTDYKFTCVCVRVCLCVSVRPSHFLSTRLQSDPSTDFTVDSLKGHSGAELHIYFLVHLESIYYEIFFYSKIVPNCAVAK